MLLRVDYGPDAKVDLLDIYEYIHADNSAAARRMVEIINRTCETLIAENPFIGRPRHELEPHLRSFPVRPYLVFYRPTPGAIEVIRVLHGARNVEAIFQR